MWGNKPANETKPVISKPSSPASSTLAHNTTTLIAGGTEIEGNIRFRGNVHIEGSVKGNISSTDGKLQLIDGSNVEGNVTAADILVNGKVVGDVYATEKLKLSHKAEIKGDVYYEVMEMVAGAAINGKMERILKSGELLPKGNAEEAKDVKKLDKKNKSK